MNALAYVVLLAWLPAALVLFARVQPLLAVLSIILGGWLFLPVVTIDLPTIPDYDKATAVTYVLLLGVLIFDGRRLASWRFKAIDLAMLMWLASAFLASLSNGYGLYDATTSIVYRIFHWGIPYFIGSLYLTTRESLRVALLAVFIAGLLYAPLCLYEVRMSPQLHKILYGFFQHAFDQTMRGGGFRPVVFTRHGLEVSLFMASATIAGVALWRHSGVTALRGMPMAGLVMLVAVAFVLCKSTGAFVLGAGGCLMLLPGLGRALRMWLLMLVPFFISVRILGGGLVEQWMLDQARLVSEDRAASLQFRFDCEQLFLGKFWQQPLFGASPWNFNLFFNPETGRVSLVTSDSLWIISAVTNGIVGLLGFLGFLWLPVLRSQFARGSGLIGGVPEFGAAGIIVLIYLVDCLFNGFVNPLCIALAGGLSRIPLRDPDPAAAAILTAPEDGRSCLLIPRPLQPGLERRKTLNSLVPREHGKHSQ